MSRFIDNILHEAKLNELFDFNSVGSYPYNMSRPNEYMSLLKVPFKDEFGNFIDVEIESQDHTFSKGGSFSVSFSVNGGKSKDESGLNSNLKHYIKILNTVFAIVVQFDKEYTPSELVILATDNFEGNKKLKIYKTVVGKLLSQFDTETFNDGYGYTQITLTRRELEPQN